MRTGHQLSHRRLKALLAAALLLAGVAALRAGPSTPPSITSGPQRQAVQVGDSASFSVTADGTAPLTNQWWFKGAPIPGQSSASLVLTNIQLTNQGFYSVTVSNAYGSASASAFLRVFQVAPATHIVGWDWDDCGDTTSPPGLTNAVAIAAGYVHSLALLSDGTVYQWGCTNAGQGPPPAGLSNVVQIAAGYYHNLAIKEDSTVVAWGLDDQGQADPPPGLSNVVSISGGYLYSLAAKGDGTVAGWGNDQYSLVSYASTLRNVTAVAASIGHALALESNGTVVGWGYSGDGRATPPAGLNNVIAIAVGNSHSLALKSDGTVVAFGDNSYGQLNIPAGLSNVVAISAGYYHSLALKKDGAVTVWGSVLPQAPADLNTAYAVSAGGVHSLALVPWRPIVFVSQPSNQTVVAGTTVTFAPSVTGTLPYLIQWRFNGADIPGATNLSLTLTNAQTPQTGGYSLLVSNVLGPVISDSANLTVVDSQPIITRQPQDSSVPLGFDLTLRVSAIGTAPIAYQWRFNGSDLPGATNSSLLLPDIQSANGGTYSVFLTNSLGPAFSSNAVVAVTPTGSALQSIAVASAADMIYDDARDILYISSGASIFRYQLGSATFLPPFQIGSNLWGMDLSLDGNTLAVADRTPSTNSSWIYLIDLPTGLSRQVTFLATNEAGTFAVAFGNDGAVLTTSDVQGLATPLPLRRYDPVSNTTSIIALLYQQSSIAASGDGRTIGVAENAFYTGPFSIYDVASRQILRSTSTGWFFLGTPCAVNHDGTQFAVPTQGGMYFYDTNLALLKVIGSYTNPMPAGVAYHPGSNLFFLAWSATRQVLAYDSITFNALAAYDFGATFGNTRLRTSRDGSLLFAKVGGGINYLRWTNAQPGISVQPTNQTVLLGGNIAFSVQAGGSPTLNYSWRFNGVELDGATNATLTLPNVQRDQGGNYSVVVYNANGFATSSNALLTVNSPPLITAPPASQTVPAGSTVSFTVNATGSQPFTYQWQFNGTNLPGANAQTLVLPNVQSQNAGSYSVLLTNAYGYAASDAATLSVTPSAPVVLLDPASQAAPAGTNVTFTVSAIGTALVAYQWRFKGLDLSNRTNSSLTLTNIQAANIGDYLVVLTNFLGGATSAPATLTVIPVPPSFVLQPQSKTATKGAEVSFSARAAGSEPITYQWQFKGGTVPGATASTLLLTNAQLADAGDYAAVAANNSGSITSATATLTITPPPGFLWARNSGVGAQDDGRAVALDKAGNIFLCGTFYNFITIGSSNLTSVGNSDIYLAKFDPAGQLLWVQTAGGTNTDTANTLAVDSAGNVLVTGSFSNTATFGNVTLTDAGGSDAFVAKYDNAGNLVWVQGMGGAGTDSGNAIAVDSSGNSYVAGVFAGTASFGTNSLTSTGGNDIFVVKYDGAGNVLWARKAGGTGSDLPHAIALDPQGNVYLSGEFFSSTAFFGSIAITNGSSPTASFSDLFLAKYDSAGNVLWATRAGGAASDSGTGLATDAAGDVFVTGNFQRTASFGALLVAAAGNSDIFVAKYDPAGNALWARSAGGASSDTGNAVAVDAGGNAYIVGRFAGTASFGNTNIVSSGSDDVFVAMYDAAGNFRWVRSGGGTASDAALGVAANDRAGVFLAGYSASLNPAFGHVILTTSGATDFILAKLAAFDPTNAPILTQPPASQNAVAGENVTFGLGFIAAGPLSYQWRFNGADITGATNAALAISNAFSPASGGYSAVIGNSFGAVTSAVANLSVAVEPDFLWALRAGGAAGDSGVATAADTNGNVFMAGYFSGSADFGATNLVSAGGEDIFIAKFAAAGNLLWLSQAGGSGNDRANAIALDGAGGVVVAGFFSGSASFGSTNLMSNGDTDAFAARFDANGNLLWARSGGGDSADAAQAIAVDSAGNVSITGFFRTNALFDTITLTNSSANNTSNDLFVAKYSPSGALLWAIKVGGSGNDQGRAIGFDAVGNVYVAGSFSFSAVFSNITLVSFGGLDIFLAKYDPSGNILWARRAGTSSQTTGYNDEATALAIDGSGNVFITGYFQNQAAFGSINIAGANSSQPDAFLAKYDSNGNALWAVPAGGLGPDSGSALAVDAVGNPYIAGYFSGTASFGSSNLISAGGTELFVALYDTAGKLMRLHRAGGIGDDAALGLATDGRGNVFLTGYHSAPAAFGNVLLANSGAKDAFLTALSLFAPDAAPLIVNPPRSQTFAFGTNFTLTAGVLSSSPVTYQWQLNETDVVGATNATLVLSNAQYAAAGNYTVTVSNRFGVTVSALAALNLEIVPDFYWLRKAGGGGDDQALAVALESSNVYAAGYFSSSVSFGSTNLISRGLADILLIKYNTNGSVIWATNAGGSLADVAQGIAADHSGNIYLAGYFQSAVATFGSLTANNPNNNTLDAFLAKYDGDGNALWVKRAGGTGADQALAVATDNSGYVYLTGSYYSTGNFGGLVLTNPNHTNFFLAKYDPQGNALWARTVTGIGASQGNAVSVAGTNVYVTGFISGSSDFGHGALANLNDGYNTVFLAKYTSNGDLLWSRTGAAGGAGVGQAALADASGSLYITVSNSFYPFYLPAQGYVTKYNSAGTVLWSTLSSGINDSTFFSGRALALDPAGNPLVGGAANMTLGTNRFTGQGFAAKFKSDDGSVLWAEKLGALGTAVAADPAGNAYFAGRFNGNANLFGSTNTLLASGGNDAFVVKLGVRPPALSVTPTNRFAVTGSNVILSVTAAGTGPFAYQWQRNGLNIVGATSNVLALAGFQPSQAGSYSVIVRNTANSVTTQVATLTDIPILNAAISGNNLVLSWGGTFILQSATNVSGPYLDVPLGYNPFTNPVFASGPKRFFRLRTPSATLRGSPSSNASFAISVAGAAGHNYQIQASTNLRDWSNLNLLSSPFLYLDTNASSFPNRFYRALLAE